MTDKRPPLGKRLIKAAKDRSAPGTYPDTVSITSLSLAAAETGMVQNKTTALLTPEEVDMALSKKVAYKAPGHA